MATLYMKLEQLVIDTVTPLVNGFSEIKLHAKQHAKLAQPGHYVILQEKYPCYLYGTQEDMICLIAREADLPLTNTRKITASSLQGTAFAIPTTNHFQLILANEEGLNAVIFYLKKYKSQFEGLVLLGAKQFPFNPCPSRLLIAGMPSDVIAALPLFEDWRVPSRLTSTIEQPGCFHGTVAQLSDIWQRSTQITKPLQIITVG